MAGEAAHLQRLANSMPYDAGSYDYRSAPLGSMDGEEGLVVPYNQVADAVVRVRNLSTVVKRRIVKEYVSGWDGGEARAREMSSKGNPMTPRELQERTLKGFNENLEVEQIVPIDIMLTHGGKKFLIPARSPTDPKTGEPVSEDPPEIVVPPGMWDLYMGNYERMHSLDPRERVNEMQAVASRGLNRFVYRDGNPYGFLEFLRQEIRVSPTVVDRDRVSRGEIVEV